MWGCGNGRSTNEIPTQERMHGQEETGDDVQFLVNNEVEDYMEPSCSLYGESFTIDIDTVHAEGFIAFQSNESTLLLDSCSTLNLLAERSLLDDIHEVEKTMQVRCSAGVTRTDLMA